MRIGNDPLCYALYGAGFAHLFFWIRDRRSGDLVTASALAALALLTKGNALILDGALSASSWLNGAASGVLRR